MIDNQAMFQQMLATRPQMGQQQALAALVRLRNEAQQQTMALVKEMQSWNSPGLHTMVPSNVSRFADFGMGFQPPSLDLEPGWNFEEVSQPKADYDLSFGCEEMKRGSKNRMR